MQDFLLELGFEELPARFVEGALRQLLEGVTKKLDQERLSYGEVHSFSTPRRRASDSGFADGTGRFGRGNQRASLNIARDAEGS